MIRFLFSTIAALLLLASISLTVDRLVGPVTPVAVVAASFASYAVVGYAVSLVLLLLVVRGAEHRQVVLFGAALALLGIGIHAYWLAPLYYGSAAGATSDVTVMTSNLHLGLADASTVVRTAADSGVEVLVLEEVTAQELTALDQAGLDTLYAHRAGRTDGSSRVTMVFSTYALSGVQPIALANGGLAVTVAAAKPFRLLAVHAGKPSDQNRQWSVDLRTLRDVAARAVDAGPTVVAGDFNATTDHALFRRILGVGLSDATAQANSGWQPTWPTNDLHAAYRPVIAIDHVLTTPDFSAVSTRTVHVPGTDHLALIARLDRI